MNCNICEQIDVRLSNVANGDAIGVSEATIRRHLKHYDKPETDPFFTDVPTSIITSRGKSVRLADGSWEKINWQPNAMALREALSYDDLERALEGFVAVDPPTKSTDDGMGLNAADLQIGKARQRWGGTPETLASCRSSFARTARLVMEERPEHLVLSDNGDIIENIWNVPAQKTTNDLDVPAQIRTARKLLLEGIKLLAPLVPRLTVLSVPSNHGGSRVGYKTPESTVDADFGLDINYQLEDVLADRDGFGHVSFVRPEPLESTALVNLGGAKVAYHHGDESGGVFKQGDWWRNIDHGRLPGWDADVLVTAHFHTDARYRSGDGRVVIACASSDPGSDWFSSHSGESARRGMTVFKISDGQVVYDRIV